MCLNKVSNELVKVKFGHSVVFTLLDKSAIEREWTGSDCISRSRTFFLGPSPNSGEISEGVGGNGERNINSKVMAAGYLDLYFRAQAQRRARSAWHGFLPMWTSSQLLSRRLTSRLGTRRGRWGTGSTLCSRATWMISSATFWLLSWRLGPKVLFGLPSTARDGD